MFTGIIETVGRVRSVSNAVGGARLEISADLADDSLKIGDSVAVNGVCLTVTSKGARTFCADISPETLKVTALSRLKENTPVNLERPLKLNGRLDGHLVQGHIDGVGKILKINMMGLGIEVELEAPRDVTKYLIHKGSVAINGTSLTISRLAPTSFFVCLIPHTIETTIFKYAKAGDPVNLEIDIIGKYVEKLARRGADETDKECRITGEFLRSHGFTE